MKEYQRSCLWRVFEIGEEGGMRSKFELQEILSPVGFPETALRIRLRYQAFGQIDGASERYELERQ
jgi:hypothetical protein